MAATAAATAITYNGFEKSPLRKCEYTWRERECKKDDFFQFQIALIAIHLPVEKIDIFPCIMARESCYTSIVIHSIHSFLRVTLTLLFSTWQHITLLWFSCSIFPSILFRFFFISGDDLYRRHTIVATSVRMYAICVRAMYVWLAKRDDVI